MALPLILIDMDGVLCDLHKDIVEFTGDDKANVDRAKFFDKYLPDFVDHDGFRLMSKMPASDHLIDVLYRWKKDGLCELAICTSAGDFYEPQCEVVYQKKAWIVDFQPKLTHIPFIATGSGKDKAFFANERTFLIDDWHKNITGFVAAGGSGVVYTPEQVDETLRAVELFCLDYIGNEAIKNGEFA